jgi:Spy/CpxP family protein refolding chaperone
MGGFMKRVGICMVLGLLVLVVSINGSFADTKALQGRMGEDCMKEEAPLPPPAAMQGGPGLAGKMRSAEPPIWRHLRELGLDEKQAESVRAIRTKALKEMVRKRADEQLAVIDLKELLGKESVDMKAVEGKLRQLESIRTDVKMAMLRSIEEVKANLTPDQRSKLKKMSKADGEMRPPMPMMKGKMPGDEKMDAKRGGPSMMSQMTRRDKRMPPPIDVEASMDENGPRY